MKTWWDYWPLTAFNILLPFILGALPTITLKGEIFGGGVIRQYAINTTAEYFPVEAGQAYVNNFMSASITEEYILFMPIALNLSSVLLLLTYLFGSLTIHLSNWIKRNEFQSQLKASKGA